MPARALATGMLLVGGCTCGDAHVRDAQAGDGAGGPDGPDAALLVDASRDAFTMDTPRDAGEPVDVPIACSTIAPRLGHLGDCTPADDEVCAAWTRAQASPGLFTHGTCNLVMAGTPICWGGDDCYLSDPFEDTWVCHCDTDPFVACLTGQVCVSDTPDGPRRCIAACSWAPDE